MVYFFFIKPKNRQRRTKNMHFILAQCHSLAYLSSPVDERLLAVKKLAPVLLVLSLFGLSACATSPSPQPLHTTEAYYNFLQPSFADYTRISQTWLRQHRQFISSDIEAELAMNSPFEKTPNNTADTAVLLVHGLADSPYTYVDIAQDLAQQGVHVEVLLLPGHGSKPEDLFLPQYRDWQAIVDHYANLLKQQYAHVWLGGFSTGANLVSVHALQQGGIDGLLLWSPAYQTKLTFVELVAPLVAQFVDWGWRAEETNLAKYSSATVNGFIAYVDSAAAARKAFNAQALDIPALVFLSEADSVVNAEAVALLFQRRFRHAGSRLIWYGENVPNTLDSRIQAMSMALPEQRISSASHMGLTFAANNPYYGVKGHKKLCDFRLNTEDKARCLRGDNTWYAAWGHKEKQRIYSRLTWNPYYNDMLQRMQAIMHAPRLAKTQSTFNTNFSR